MIVNDGFKSLRRGMNSGTLNTNVDYTQYAKGINVTCRNDVISTRPPFIEIAFATEDEGLLERLEYGKFQGMYKYQHGDDVYIAFGMSGYVFIIDPVSGALYDVSSAVGNFNEYVDRLHFVQVETYLVVQDGLNAPLIVEGTASRKAVQASPTLEVPTGTVMAYCHGRLFIKTADKQFVAGNINMPSNPGNVLRFVESTYLANGGAFFTPATIGNIVAMTWAQNYGTGTAQGPLVVMCQEGIASYAVYEPRAQWQDLPIQKIEPSGSGCATEFGVVRMNEDLLFIGWNGLEDMSLLSSEAATTHRLTNLNTEIKEFFSDETTRLLQFAHGTRFDNRLLFTSIGEEVSALDSVGMEIQDYRFTGLMSLDFAPRDGIGQMGKTQLPSFDGLWTGVHPMGIASGVFDYDERCFVFGKDDDGKNHLYRLMKDPGLDRGFIPPKCSLYTRGMPFISVNESGEPMPVEYLEKILRDAFLYIYRFENNVAITLSVCTDFSVQFHEISEIRLRAPMVDDAFVTGFGQPRPRERFPAFVQTEAELGYWSIRSDRVQFSIQARLARDSVILSI